MDEEIEEGDFSLDESDDMLDDFDDDTDFRMLIEADVADICNTYVKFSELNINSLLPFESRPIVSLTQEERDVINKCNDDKLTGLLILNRAHASQVRELMKQLQIILTQCNKCITKGKQSVVEMKEAHQVTPRNIIRSAIWKTAAPYFKDSQFYGAPPNADVIKKQKNGELCLLEVNEGRRWSNADKRALIKNVKLQYFNYRHHELRKALSLKKSQAKNKTRDEKTKLELEINSLNEEISALKPAFPPLNVTDGIDWLNISSVALKGKHPVIECIAFWNMILHPSLNTDEWSSTEEQKLQELVKIHQFQDWDQIALELDTNRSPFAAAKHYLSNFATKFKKDRFTPEEDEYLLEVIDNVRLGSYIPWGKVAYYFENRSKYQLYHRYTYYLSYKNVKKGTFTAEEDAMLIVLVKKFGKNFKKIAKYIPNRSPVQLRNRYGNYLDQDVLQVGSYSYDDDYTILEHVKKHGDKSWGRVAKALQRTRAHVRQRYSTVRKWIEKNPGLNLTHMPRRNRHSIMKNHSIRSKRISAILQHLSSLDYIPNLQSLEDLKRSKTRKTNIFKTTPKFRIRNIRNVTVSTGVDKDIIDFFKGTCKFQKEPSVLNADMHMESARRIIKLMELFNENVECLRHADEDDDFLNLKTSTTLTYIKNILETELTETILLDCHIEDAVAGPSKISDSLLFEGKDIKSFLPPTIRTLLGFRGLIIKFNMYKNKYKIEEDSKSHISSILSWKLEQSLLKCDSLSRSILEYERNLFFKRLYSVFKWPIILSNQFPTHISFLNSTPDSDDNISSSDDNKISTNKKSRSTPVTFKINLGVNKMPNNKVNKVGRPRKVLSAKVISMNNARLAKMRSSKLIIANNKLPENEVQETARPNKEFSAKVIEMDNAPQNKILSCCSEINVVNNQMPENTVHVTDGSNKLPGAKAIEMDKVQLAKMVSHSTDATKNKPPVSEVQETSRPNKAFSAKLIQMDNPPPVKMVSRCSETNAANNKMPENNLHETGSPNKVFSAKVIEMDNAPVNKTLSCSSEINVANNQMPENKIHELDGCNTLLGVKVIEMDKVLLAKIVSLSKEAAKNKPPDSEAQETSISNKVNSAKLIQMDNAPPAKIVLRSSEMNIANNKMPESKILETDRSNKVLSGKLIKMDKAPFIKMIPSDRVIHNFYANIYNPQDVDSTSKNVINISKIEPLKQNLSISGDASKIMIKSEPMEDMLPSTSALAIDEMNDNLSTKNINTEQSVDTDLKVASSTNKSQVASFLPSTQDETAVDEYFECIPKDSKPDNLDECDALQAWLSFDNDIRNLVIANEIEVSSEIDAKVMKDVEALEEYESFYL